MTEKTVVDTILRATSEKEEFWTPAVPAAKEQRDDLERRLRRGFESREEILLWLHSVAAVTAGNIDTAWVQEFVRDRWNVAACLRDSALRESMSENPPNQRQAESAREDIIKEFVAPAYRAALSDIQRNAGDYTLDDDGVSDVENQRFIGLRPRVHQWAAEQNRLLRWTLGESDRPISSQSDLNNWEREADTWTRGFHELLDYSPTDFRSEWWAELTHDGTSYLMELLIADELLPAMAAALRDAVENGEEHPETLDTSPDVDPSPKNAY